MRAIADRPLGLYLHLPWCVSRCPYCDFNSHEFPGELPEVPYTTALLNDLERESRIARHEGWIRPFTSAFIGGGTPSLFSSGSIGQMLDQAARLFGFTADAEITLEANPGSVERHSFTGLRDTGVNRVSLGAQSFNDASLRALGRVHRAEETTDAVEEIRRSGIDNLNIDIMFALPGQSVADAQRDVEAALALGPQHLSYYQLTLEPNTAFYRHPPALPDEELAWEMQHNGIERLAKAGFGQYEVAAHAPPGSEARHNLNYWTFGDYVGLGAGAHGKITLSGGQVVRTSRPRSPQAYMRSRGTDQPCDRSVQALTARDLVFEYALNHLRLRHQYLKPGHFETATGLDRSALAGPIARACDRGLLAHHGESGYQTTTLGWRFLNDLQAIFLPDAQDRDQPQRAV
ncbi:MAG: radical SAM family heme chaperone HemW [Pseudomonadota bacterium]